MKSRAESLDADLDALKAAFSEISRLVPEVAVDEEPEQRSGSRSNLSG
jgi:vacuolar protein sorting-associated protein 51